MSASAITPAQAELISSLSQDDIPIKLRCAICSRLAVNAFRLPCCDQSICETCQSTLPSTCPVCEHSPVASEDCKPHKSLRTTIRVFLRTEEKKREALRSKEAKDTPPDTPIELEPESIPVLAVAPTPLSSTAPVTNNVSTGEVKSELSPTADIAELAPANPGTPAQLQEAQQDIPQPSIEEVAPGQESTLEADSSIPGDAVTVDEDGPKDETGGKTSDYPTEGVSQTPAFGAGFGFDPGAASGFDMNQMQMMMAMQNGMAPNGFGNFPMIGMSGMNMDPMMMQNMFMNGGFGAGMGINNMNGMSTGMGMGGFEGGIGGGFNNGYWGDGQQSWNVGPDNFYPNSAGMGSGEYGANNSGYASHAAGYNQGNYGRGNHYNDYQNNSFGYRGRGRGRGGYNRGGYGYGSHETSQQHPPQFGSGGQPNGPFSETGSIPTGPKAESVPAGNVDEFGRELRQTSEAKEEPAESEMPKDGNTAALGPAVKGDDTVASTDQSLAQVGTESGDTTFPQPIQTLDEVEAPYAQTGNYNGYHNNQHAGRGGFYNGLGSMHPPIKPVDIPINAPTGPKAMREGLPNTSIAHLRARGLVPASPSTMVNGSTSVAPEPSENNEGVKDKSRSPSRERSRSRSRSRDRRRSRSTERHRSHRHRHRSTSLTEDNEETERRRQRRKERRRHRDEQGHERDDTGSGDKTVDEVKVDADQDRSRTASPSASKRSSHRSRRDKDKYRERERDSDRERRSSHKHRSSHRSHRDDRSRSRDRDRDRERDGEHRHRRSRRGSDALEEKVESSVPPAPIEAELPIRRTSLISNGTNGIEIKGAGIRRKNVLEEIVIPTGPRASRDRQNEKLSATSRHREDEHRSRHRDSDKGKERERVEEKEAAKPPLKTAPAVRNPHEVEREARNRERLLKEAQRMAGLTGLTAGPRKRSRDDDDDTAGRRGKKKGRRGGGVEESDEDRIARLEAERESSRW